MAEDAQFKALLAQRIGSYLDEEARVDRRIDELNKHRESLVARRETAEALYKAEFGEPFTVQEHQKALPIEREVLTPGPYTGLSWADAIARVLNEAGEPLHIKDIWERLRDGGFRTDSRDPLRSIVSILVRGADFMKVGPNRYALGQTRLLRLAEPSEGGGAAH